MSDTNLHQMPHEGSHLEEGEGKGQGDKGERPTCLLKNHTISKEKNSKNSPQTKTLDFMNPGGEGEGDLSLSTAKEQDLTPPSSPRYGEGGPLLHTHTASEYH